MPQTTPFLTLEDPNARIKGSRDPLGLVVLWSTFGRRVVCNLTTQSNSVRGFTTLLLGRWLGERLVAANKIHAEDALDVFLRTEQACAYVRHVAHDVGGEIRGIERVQRNWHEFDKRPWIGTDPRALILSDQKTYGLWGLFTVPARVSGWLPDGPLGITPRIREFIETHYWPILKPVRGQLEKLVAKGGRLNTRRGGDAVFRALASVLHPELSAHELDLYRHDLRDGMGSQSSTGNLQQHLRAVLEDHGELEQELGRLEMNTIIQHARTHSEALAEQLERIACLEALLAPADRLFQHILARSGQSVAYLAEEIVGHWEDGVPLLDRNAFQELLPTIRSATGDTIAIQIDACHAALAANRYDDAIRTLVEWNRLVMDQRQSGPWVRLDAHEVLDVRYRGIEKLLPTNEELPTLWQNSYFIDSLKTVTRQLQAKSGADS